MAKATHDTIAIPLFLPPVQALALAQFTKRIDYETVARFSSITAAYDDGQSESDLVWLALITLRQALGACGFATR
jgi:hypothetical protein